MHPRLEQERVSGIVNDKKKSSVKGGKAIVERGNELLVSLFVTCDSLTPGWIFQRLLNKS